MKNISCTDDSVKNIYSIHDMLQADWKQVENEFLYKKAAIANDLASHVLGHLRVKHLISFTPSGISVDRDKINVEFGLFQRAVPDPVTFDKLDNDSGYSTSSSSSSIHKGINTRVSDI